MPAWSTQKGRSADRKNINAAISEITRTKPSEHWIELFEAAGIPCGPINTIDRVFADPQVQHLKMATPVTHPRLGTKEVVASPINLVGHPKTIRSATPDAGEHTMEVLRGLGYGETELADMKQRGIV